MPDKPLLPCPCGGEVIMYRSEEGGRHEAGAWATKCQRCKVVVDHMPSNCSGRKRDAIAEWNRDRKKAIKAAAQPKKA